jgi:hypothetical protein
VAATQRRNGVPIPDGENSLSVGAEDDGDRVEFVRAGNELGVPRSEREVLPQRSRRHSVTMTSYTVSWTWAVTTDSNSSTEVLVGLRRSVLAFFFAVISLLRKRSVVGRRSLGRLRGVSVRNHVTEIRARRKDEGCTLRETCAKLRLFAWKRGVHATVDPRLH